MTDHPVRTAIAVHVAVVAALLFGLSTAGFTPALFVDTTWWTPFVVLNVGILVGNVAFWWAGEDGGEAARILGEARREDLAHTRAVVVEQLRALEAERDKLPAEDYARERAELLSVGASAARELDEQVPTTTAGESTQVRVTQAGGPVTAPGAQPPTLVGEGAPLVLRLQAERDADREAFEAALAKLGYGARDGMAAWRGAGVVLLLVAMVGGFVWMAGDQATTRQQGMPMTGGESVQGPSGPSPTEAQARWEERLAQDPNDVEALNELTDLAFGRGDARKALEYNQRAREIAPDNPDTIAFSALMLAQIGRGQDAIALLENVLADHPDHVRALIFLGLLTSEIDPEGAVAKLERAVALEDNVRNRRMLALVRERAAKGPAPAAPSPSAAPPGEAADPPAGTVLVAGTLSLPEATGTGVTTFVSIRPAGGGRPVAAVKLAPGPFPMAFSITSNDVIPMGGGGIPDKVEVVARLDSDGNPMTRPPTDPSATLEDVAPGTTGLMLELR